MVPEDKKAWRILIVDDHPLVRKGIMALIAGESGFEVSGECDNPVQGIEMAESLRPDLAIVDISLKTGNGLELVKQLAGKFPDIKILVYSVHDESLFAERCLRAGAMGYLNKEASGESLFEALQTIQSGKTYVSPELAERLLSRIVGGGVAPLSPIETLTDRELEVFNLIGHGLTTRQISERLQLSYKTIESYRENIKAKLSLKNASELNRHAVRWVLEMS